MTVRLAIWLIFSTFICGCCLFSQAHADDEDLVRHYRTPEERRNAGVPYFLTDWFSIAGLLEGEYAGRWSELTEYQDRSFSNDNSQTLQVEAEFVPLAWLKAEVVYEMDYQDRLREDVDEAIVAIEYHDLYLDIGKLYVPFGEYFSRLVSGPLLEFGETRAPGAILSYEDEDWEFLAFLYNGDAEREGSDSSATDYGYAFRATPTGWLFFGASYITDLADSKERLLDDLSNRYRRRVPALSGFMAIGDAACDMSFEFIKALGSFAELETEEDSPWAWNLELSYLTGPRLDLAIRYEQGSDIPDSPFQRVGGGISYRLTRSIIWSSEALLEWFHHGFAEDSRGREIGSQLEFVTQVSIEL